MRGLAESDHPQQPRARPTAYRGKRAFDLAAAAPAALLLAPLMASLALLVRWRLGRPVLFHQARPGVDGVPFTLYKFRTMSNACDAQGVPLPDSQRLTRLGRLLRSTSLDELPELFNVLCGDMSLVGPRPLLTAYLDRYTPHQARRHEARPGITGLAQVSGRNALDWDERLALDVWYVDHQSLALDLRILARTLVQVARRQGITTPGEATAREFQGSASSLAGEV